MAKYKYNVLDNQRLTPTVRSVRLVPKGDSAPLLYEPGQYAAISLHDGWRPTTTRCFSIASSPTDRGVLEFCARVGGAYTSALERLIEGDAVFVRGPFGRFVLPQYIPKDLVFFAGGIGITPFVSMLRYASALHLARDIHLIYSCRNQDDIPFFDELVALERRNPHLRITYVVTGGPTDRLRGLEVVTGKVDELMLRTLGFQYSKRTYMICGPAGYLAAMRTLLEERGVPHANIVTEAFSQGSKSQTSSFVGWPANMYALSGISLVAAGFLVTTSDLMKTLPQLETAYEPAEADGADIIGEAGIGGISAVHAIPPQVDTNITPEPVVVQQTDTDKATSQNVTKPTVTPTSTAKPTPTVTPTVVAQPAVQQTTAQAPASQTTQTQTNTQTTKTRTLTVSPSTKPRTRTS